MGDRSVFQRGVVGVLQVYFFNAADQDSDHSTLMVIRVMFLHRITAPHSASRYSLIIKGYLG